MNESLCKCGKKILWVETIDGKKIPLDATAPVYDLSVKNECDDTPIAYRARKSYVLHFATCKFANEFSKKNKKDQIKEEK